MATGVKLPSKNKTGIEGLDDILIGGFADGRLFLIEGTPGAGKTTLALQFLLAGAETGEKGLLVTLAETEEELRQAAQSHGWVLGDKITVFELAPPENLLDDNQQQSLLYSSDLELGETTRRIFEAVEAAGPKRVVIDSLSEIKLLAQSTLRYRRQVLALKHYFARTGATVLMLDDMTTETRDQTVHSVAHGVIRLEELVPEYGAERRRLRVLKYRGQRFRGGFHDFVIETGGLRVFPRLVAAEHQTRFARTQLPCGIAEMDALLGGGIERGSSTLILGPAGTGKSLLAMHFVVRAVERGERVALFIFDEELGLLFERAKSVGLEIERYRDEGKVFIEQIDAAEMSPGEFAYQVCGQVTHLSAKTVVIDSINGYQAAMPDEKFLLLHMHELLQFLNRQGATTFLTVAQHGLVGEMHAPVDITYLADTVILLRYFEAFGTVRRAVSIVKKRTGFHESTIREFRISRQGIIVGPPLKEFEGVLRGVPTYRGKSAPSMDADS